MERAAAARDAAKRMTLVRAWLWLHWRRLIDRLAPIDEVHP